MKLNTTPENRKDMAHAISERLGIPCVYQGTPTYAYAIGNITVNRDGTIDSDDLEAVAQIQPMLVERGWLEEVSDTNSEAEETTALETTTPATDLKAAPPDDELPTPFHIRLPIGDLKASAICNLLRVLYSRQELINRMLQMPLLHIDYEVMTLLNDSRPESVSDLKALLAGEEAAGMLQGVAVSEEMLTFSMPLCEESSERSEDYTLLLAAIWKLAASATRVKAQKLPLTEENEKYYANAWLARLGFGGAQHKELRRRLMGHLRGFAAFKDSTRMQAHLEKCKANRIARHDLEAETETSTDERPEA